MAQTVFTISIVSFIAAGVFATLGVALWFLFKIPTVMGDLSGRNAKKSIERMRKNNEKTGNKTYKSSGTNVERGKLTGTMKGAGKGDGPGEDYETGLLNENGAKTYEGEDTGLLMDEDATGILDGGNQTEPLDMEEQDFQRRETSVEIRLIDEVMYVHTKDKIREYKEEV